MWPRRADAPLRALRAGVFAGQEEPIVACRGYIMTAEPGLTGCAGVLIFLARVRKWRNWQTH